MPGGEQLAAAFGGSLPPVLWDGLGPVPGGSIDNNRGMTLNLPAQGADTSAARPAPFGLAPVAPGPAPAAVGAPVALDARIAQ
jgi:hypothetical protein